MEERKFREKNELEDEDNSEEKYEDEEEREKYYWRELYSMY
jgi:hypothetical protein